MREFAKEKAGKDSFVEVYTKASIEECAKRDPKGLYKKAAEGEINNFTGVTAPYEEPETPDLIIDTTEITIEEAMGKVFELILMKID